MYICKSIKMSWNWLPFTYNQILRNLYTLLITTKHLSLYFGCVIFTVLELCPCITLYASRGIICYNLCTFSIYFYYTLALYCYTVCPSFSLSISPMNKFCPIFLRNYSYTVWCIFVFINQQLPVYQTLVSFYTWLQC